MYIYTRRVSNNTLFRKNGAIKFLLRTQLLVVNQLKQVQNTRPPRNRGIYFKFNYLQQPQKLRKIIVRF